MGVPIPSDIALAGIADGPPGQPEPAGNSCVIVVATDAPLDARQLGRVARRALAGLAGTGSDFAGGSGDYAIAFSTAPPGERVRPDADLDPLFRATITAWRRPSSTPCSWPGRPPGTRGTSGTRCRTTGSAGPAPRPGRTARRRGRVLAG